MRREINHYGYKPVWLETATPCSCSANGRRWVQVSLYASGDYGDALSPESCLLSYQSLTKSQVWGVKLRCNQQTQITITPWSEWILKCSWQTGGCFTGMERSEPLYGLRSGFNSSSSDFLLNPFGKRWESCSGLPMWYWNFPSEKRAIFSHCCSGEQHAP